MCWVSSSRSESALAPSRSGRLGRPPEPHATLLGRALSRESAPQHTALGDLSKESSPRGPGLGSAQGGGPSGQVGARPTAGPKCNPKSHQRTESSSRGALLLLLTQNIKESQLWLPHRQVEAGIVRTCREIAVRQEQRAIEPGTSATWRSCSAAAGTNPQVLSGSSLRPETSLTASWERFLSVAGLVFAVPAAKCTGRTDHGPGRLQARGASICE